jgi:cyclic-di-GMP phosphodiesterase TipF (flagellum assembly factor)
MRRIGAVLIAVSMVLIAAFLGAVLYLGFNLDSLVCALAALAALSIMSLYTTVSSSLRDRRELGDQIADLSRGTADIARQVGDISRRLSTVEASVDSTVARTRAAVDPLAAEIDELDGLVREITETVAVHATALQKVGGLPAPPAAAEPAPVLAETDPAGGARGIKGHSREGLVELIAKAVEANRIDLYLQPIVTLPQRKVRYYEALTRLRTEDGDIIPAADFIDAAESAGLMPKIDSLLLYRCVQVTRRLQLKSRDVGLFCNISAATLRDSSQFGSIRDFLDASRALSNALIFEFKQSACRAFGPRELESLSALAELDFRFSMDHVADMGLDPKELAEGSFRFVKVPAKLLLDPAAGAHSDIHPTGLADLLARSGIDLVAEHIESESTVVELLDCDVRLGQGFLFSGPRPVRAEAFGGPDKALGEVTGEPAPAHATIG